MARLWRNDPAIPGGCKYLVQRRDGTVPEWPSFVLGARDPAAPTALRAYADAAEKLNFDPAYVADLRQLAADFEEWRKAHGDGDPDAPRHRIDNPEIIARMTGCGNAAPDLTGVAAPVLELGRALDVLAKDHSEWSQATFGTDLERGPIGPLKHLEKEAREAQGSPHDRSEYADCLLLVLDAARRAGMSPYDLVIAAQKKMLVNRLRKWSRSTSDEPVEHVRAVPRKVLPGDPDYRPLDEIGRLALKPGDEVAVLTDSGAWLAFTVSAAPWQMYGGTWVLGLKDVSGCYFLGRVVAKRIEPAPDAGQPVHAGEWGSLPNEPCRFCRTPGGVEFLIDSGPEGKAGFSPVRCRTCGRDWVADSTSA